MVLVKAEVEIEGGYPTWWYVCSECHGCVEYKAKTCSHCRAELDWSGVELPKEKQIHRGEQTEPAE